MSTDTNTSQLVINKLTKAQYEAISNPSNTELYLTPDTTDADIATAVSNHNSSNSAHSDIRSDISTINGKIPQQASSSNQLADKDFVNSSISTNTANFRGTSATGLTEAQFLAWADTLTKTNNDYVFWNTVDSDGNTIYKRYKYNGTNWIYEYTLNNSSFTANQWASINSGITSSDVTQIGTNTTNIALKENSSNKSDSYTASSSTTYASTKALVDGLATKQNVIDSSHKLPASNVSGLATVSTSGSYNDLSNKPTIPTVNDGTITITQGGVTKGTFTVNQSGNTTVALDSGSSYTAGDNITINNNVISAVDTKPNLYDIKTLSQAIANSGWACLSKTTPSTFNTTTTIYQDIKNKYDNVPETPQALTSGYYHGFGMSSYTAITKFNGNYYVADNDKILKSNTLATGTTPTEIQIQNAAVTSFMVGQNVILFGDSAGNIYRLNNDDTYVKILNASSGMNTIIFNYKVYDGYIYCMPSSFSNQTGKFWKVEDSATVSSATLVKTFTYDVFDFVKVDATYYVYAGGNVYATTDLSGNYGSAIWTNPTYTSNSDGGNIFYDNGRFVICPIKNWDLSYCYYTDNNFSSVSTSSGQIGRNLSVPSVSNGGTIYALNSDGDSSYQIKSITISTMTFTDYLSLSGTEIWGLGCNGDIMICSQQRVYYAGTVKQISTDTYVINGSTVTQQYYLGSSQTKIISGQTDNTATIYAGLGYSPYFTLTVGTNVTLPRNSNLWTMMYVGDDYQDSDLPIGNADALQNKTNLVTSISSSSTNIQYPSAKCVYTGLNSKVTANNAITGSTKCKITYDSKGLVTAGANLSASDIPNLNLSKITDVTATASEVNVLDGITASTTELNYTDGVTSNIQTQLNGKQDTLVSGTNIKTINNQSILGSGDIEIQSGTNTLYFYENVTGTTLNTGITLSNNNLVFKNGVGPLKLGQDYTINGTVITFTTSITSGARIGLLVGLAQTIVIDNIATLTSDQSSYTLNPNIEYKVSIGSSVSTFAFVLATPSNTDISNSILVHAYIGATSPSITWGTSHYFNAAPSVATAGYYDICYVYNPQANYWVVSVTPIL